jgi:predicted permease
MPDWARLLGERLGERIASDARVSDVLEELEQHVEDRYRELRGQGVPPDEARDRALAEATSDRALGKWLGRGGRSKKVRPIPPGENGGSGTGLLHDVRYAVRLMRHSPGFTAAAVAALGLGAGAAIGVYTLLQAVVLRPLPYPEPDRLVRLWEAKPAEGLLHERVSPVTFLDYRAAPGLFEDAAAWWVPEVNLVDDLGEPIRVATVSATGNFFDLMGISPVLGPGFARDSALEGDAEAVISDRLWRTRFGASPDIVGRSIRLNGLPHEVMGVMPPGFHFPDETDLWTRISWNLAEHSREAHFMGAVARLGPDVTLEGANVAVRTVGDRVARDFPQTNEGWNARVVPLVDEVVGVFRPGLIALFGAAGLLLLIACMNVANLLLARAGARQGEFAVRAALGASRKRLMRQFLIESVLLATAASVVGFVIATFVVRGFLAWSPIEIPRADGIAIDAGVLMFTLAVIGITTVVFGVVPAAQASRVNLQSVLRETSRGQVAGHRGRSALVISEIALSVALLSGAGLLVRSVSALLAEDIGASAAGELVIDMQLPQLQYGWHGSGGFYGQLLADLRDDPRVAGVAAANFLPLETGWRVPFGIAGLVPLEQDGQEHIAQYHSVSESFFDAAGARLIEGRGFTARDDSTGRPVVVVNRTFVERFLPDTDAVLGRTLLVGAHQIGPLGRRLVESEAHEIVGVVADIRNTGFTAPAEPAVYTSFRQFPFFQAYLLVQPASTPEAAVSAVRDAVRRLDPGLPLGSVQPYDRVLGAATDANRVIMLLMLVFSGMALLLAVIGLYGILSYTVSMRRREIGIRLALGARARDVLAMVVRYGLLLGVLGVVLGLMLAGAAGRALSGLLFDVSPLDALTLGAVAVLVLAVTLAAAFAPARRAAATDPIRTLRQE